jgi:hypothetical protein
MRIKGLNLVVTLRMFLSAMQFIIKIYPNIQFHLGAIVCAEIGNSTTTISEGNI